MKKINLICIWVVLAINTFAQPGVTQIKGVSYRTSPTRNATAFTGGQNLLSCSKVTLPTDSSISASVGTFTTLTVAGGTITANGFWKTTGNTLTGNGSFGSLSNHAIAFKSNNITRGTLLGNGHWQFVTSLYDDADAIFLSPSNRTLSDVNGVTSILFDTDRELIDTGGVTKLSWLSSDSVSVSRYLRGIATTGNYVDFGHNGGIYLRNTGSYVGLNAQSGIIDINTSNDHYILGDNTLGARPWVIRGDVLSFYQSTDGIGTVFNITHGSGPGIDNVIAYLNSTGNEAFFGIGTTAPRANFEVVGKTIFSNSGSGTLVAGIDTVFTSAVTATSLIYITPRALNGATGIGSPSVVTVSAGNYFVVKSLNSTAGTETNDTRLFDWIITEKP